MVQADDYRLPLPQDIRTFPEAKSLLTDCFQNWVIPVSLKMLDMYPQHVAEYKKLSEQFIKSLKACGDNVQQAKQLLKDQLADDSEERNGGVTGCKNKFKLFGMLQDNELISHLKKRVSMWTAKLKVASQRAESDLNELLRRINETQEMIVQIYSDDPKHALNSPLAEQS